MYEAIEKETGHDLYGKTDDEILAIAKELHIPLKRDGQRQTD
jgi:lysyl-tRNA synthetase, class II